MSVTLSKMCLILLTMFKMGSDTDVVLPMAGCNKHTP